MVTLYITLAIIWTLYVLVRGIMNKSKKREHFVGLLISAFVFFPFTLTAQLITEESILRYDLRTIRSKFSK